MAKTFNKNWHLIIIALAFAMCLISLYFGGSIYSAAANEHITHLNQMENIGHYSVEDIVDLSKSAATITLPFILLMLTFILLIRWRAKNKLRKKVAGGMLLAICIILVFDIMTLSKPAFFDFGGWGYVWITFSILIIMGNIYSYFLPVELKD